MHTVACLKISSGDIIRAFLFSNQLDSKVQKLNQADCDCQFIWLGFNTQCAVNILSGDNFMALFVFILK